MYTRKLYTYVNTCSSLTGIEVLYNAVYTYVHVYIHVYVIVCEREGEGGRRREGGNVHVFQCVNLKWQSPKWQCEYECGPGQLATSIYI